MGSGAAIRRLTTDVAHRARRGRLPSRLSLVLRCLIVIAAVHATPLRASDDEAPEPTRSTWSKALWGQAQESTAYLGMWTRHFHPGVDNNQMIAIDYRGYFGGTFINSYGQRSYAAGFDRTLLSRTSSSNLAYGIGYRLGVIQGYDSRLLSVAGKTPVVPFLQATGDLSWKRIGIEGTYCVRVVTWGFFVRLARH
jgi:hypothetical protein